MPTVKLTASAYSVSSSHLTVADAVNMYTDTSSTTYGTVTNTNSSTSSYYLYLNGFDVTSVPRNAVIESLSIKIKGSFSDGYSSSLYLIHGTTTISGATASGLSSSVGTKTFTIPDTLTWEQICDWGSDFGIRVNCRRNKKGTTAYYYIYGAEIEVTYSTSADPPIITVGTPSTIIISDESGHDQCTCTFESDTALSQWEARATKAGTTPARGVGLLVESGGALAAHTSATIIIDDEELTQGDGEYTITVYGLSTGGVWSG